MATWTDEELAKIGAEDELDISCLRSDGTLTKPVRIWVVRVGDDLYVRPVKGREGWHRATQVRHTGRIESAGIEKDVTFEDVDHAIDSEIDASYRAKYRSYPDRYVTPILTDAAKDAGVKLVPR